MYRFFLAQMDYLCWGDAREANFHEKAHFVKGDVAAPFVLERYGSVSFAPCFHPHFQ
jgi:hypothetical protein